MKNPQKKYYRFFLPLCLIALPTLSAQDESNTPAEDDAPAFVLPDAEAGSESSAETASTEAGESLQLPSDSQEASAEIDEEVFQILPDFVVSAERDQGYYSANSLAGTRTNQLIKNTPMTISVVNQDLIDDLNLYGIDDLATVVPSVEAQEESFSNRLLRFRGLLTRFQLYEFMPRQLSQDGYNVSRVDVIRGANSLVYGQAAPGGKANFLANRAHFGDTEHEVGLEIGTNDYLRGYLDSNLVVNDKLAIRVMATHQEKEFDQIGKSQEFDGATIAVTYRPTDKTQFQLHLERVETDRSSPPGVYQDKTGKFGYTGILEDLPATPDIVDLLSSSAFNAIANYNDGTLTDLQGAPDPIPDFVVTRQDLKDFYTKQVLRDGSGQPVVDGNGKVTYIGPSHDGFSDPDKSVQFSPNDRTTRGFFLMGDVTHQFSDTLQGKVAYSHEESETDVLKRGDPKNVYFTSKGNLAAGRARDYAEGLFISPYWQTTESFDDTDAVRSTLSWETEFLGSEQQILMGLDFDQRRSGEINQDQLDSAPNADGTFGGGTRAEDYFLVSAGTPAPGLSLDNQATSNVSENGTLIMDNAPVGFFDKELRTSTVRTGAIWTAAQGKYMNGRLHTLAGIRFDRINVDAEINDVQKGVSAEINEYYDQLSPSLGALFWVTEDFGFFANYAESIESPNGWKLDPEGSSVPPETGKGYEAGIKFDLLDGKLTGQILAFHIEKQNDPRPIFGNILSAFYPQSEYPNLYDPVTGDFEPIGNNISGTEILSRGFEADIYYNPTNALSLFLGYAYVDSEYLSSRDAEYALPGGGVGLYDPLENLTPPGQAFHNINFTVRYSFKDGFLKGWYVGMNEKYRSRSLLGTFYEDVDGNSQADYIPVNDGGTLKQPRSHEVWGDDTLETDLFVGWRGKLFGGGRDAAVWNFQATVKNAFDSVNLVSTGNPRFTDGRFISFKASAKF